MRLIELSANQASFRTVRFNRNGLSLIVGRKSDPEDHSREHSFNGVGKSLLLYLVNFCLGSKTNQELAEKLPDWEFRLTYELNGNTHRLARSTTNQNKVTLDDDEISLSAYTDLLGQTLFELSSKVKFLTFRSLISQFCRQGKPGYMEFDQTAKGEKQYARLLRSAYLLGLDESLVDRKRELREEATRLKDIQKQFKTDSLLRDYYHGDRDVSLEIQELDDSIARLDAQAKAFQVAENYETVVKEADTTRKAWRQARNELHGLESSLKQIEASLTEQPELGTEQVREMYNSAQLELPDLVIKRLEEVAQFHAELVASRSRRLTSEKHRIERRVSELNAELAKLDADKDRYFQFLGSHGALSEYEALHGTLSEKRHQVERLRDFQSLQQEFEERSQTNELEMSQENIRATEYLKSAKTLTDEHNDRFRSMAKRIWPANTSGLVVHNNQGDNQIRFDIQPRIQSDASDGIGETKIFCFDMTVLLAHKNHSLRCLMHDNRLYPGIDPRQRAELFRVAHEESTKNDCQYIASLNEDNLTSMNEEMDAEEFESLLKSHTVLELTDDSDTGKLLGITVDLSYDKSRKK